MRGDRLSGKIINMLWLISLEIFGILIFFPILQHKSIFLPFQIWITRSALKKMIYIFQRFILKVIIVEPVRILLTEKIHALFPKRTLLIHPLTVLLFWFPQPYCPLCSQSKTHVMCHFRTFALVLPFSCKYLSPEKLRLNSLILVLL